MLEYLRLLRDVWRTRRNHRQWWKPSDRSHAEPQPWPERFGPGKSPVYAHNRIKIARPREQVFRRLILAEQWPDWYDNAIDVVIHRPPARRFTSRVSAEVREGRALERVGGGVAAPEPEPEQLTPPDAIPGAGPPSELDVDAEFSWTTFGIRVRSRVTEFVPDERIGWTARGLGVRVFHRWFFRPDGQGTLVVTEECERGPLPWLTRSFMNKALHAGHQLWLESLREPRS
jgi:hypothetical protein